MIEQEKPSEIIRYIKFNLTISIVSDKAYFVDL